MITLQIYLDCAIDAVASIIFVNNVVIINQQYYATNLTSTVPFIVVYLYLYLYLSVYPSIYLSIYLSIYIYIYIYVYIYIATSEKSR